MTTDKKTKQKQSELPRCDRKRCMNTAELFPILVIPAPKWSHYPESTIEMELGVNVCNKHAIDDVSEFMDDDGYKQMAKAFAARRMAKPEHKRMSIIFRALKDRQFA